MSISVFSVDKLLKPMDYETAAAAVPPPQSSPLDTATMHSDSDSDSKCSSPVNSHHSESLDVRNASNLSQDILQTMIQSCRRLAANELTRCECSDEDRKKSRNNNRGEGDGKCDKCANAKKFNLSLSDSFQKDGNKCNTIISSEPVKPVLKFSVSAILSGTKSSNEERIFKGTNRNGKKGASNLLLHLFNTIPAFTAEYSAVRIMR